MHSACIQVDLAEFLRIGSSLDVVCLTYGDCGGLMIKCNKYLPFGS